MPPRDGLRLGEMINAAERAIELANGRSVEQLRADATTREALLWNFTVLGEAANQIEPDFRAVHPELNWSRPVQLRNRIVHGYWSIDLDVLLTTARQDLPGYVEQLRAIHATLDS